MTIPLVASLSEDAMRAVPRALREGAYALGGTKLEVAWQIVVPAAISGIIASFILAMSRAVGETMIVAFAAGSKAQLTANPLQPMQTMTGFIVQAFSGDVVVGSPPYLLALCGGTGALCHDACAQRAQPVGSSKVPGGIRLSSQPTSAAPGSERASSSRRICRAQDQGKRDAMAVAHCHGVRDGRAGGVALGCGFLWRPLAVDGSHHQRSQRSAEGRSATGDSGHLVGNRPDGAHCVPVGVGAAVYLEEYAPNNRWTRLLKTNIANLAGVPSVVYGLLGLGVFVSSYARENGAIGALTMAFLILPVVIIASQEAIRAVPPSLRKLHLLWARRSGRWRGITSFRQRFLGS